MKTRVVLNLSVGLILFLLGGFVMNHMVDAQQRGPSIPTGNRAQVWPMKDGDWDYWTYAPDMFTIPDGNVGIGTDNPITKLDIDGADIRLSNPQANLILNDDGMNPMQSTVLFARQNVNKGAVSYEHSNDVLNILVGDPNNVDVLITSDGKVGIGTTDPQGKLDISGGPLAAEGDPGSSGQVLVSRGTGVSPVWGSVVSAIYDYNTSTSSYTVKDIGDLKICYGTLTCNSSGTSVINLPFTNANSYRVTTAFNGNSENYTVGVTQNSGSQFTAYKSQGSEIIHWIAIGT